MSQEQWLIAGLATFCFIIGFATVKIILGY